MQNTLLLREAAVVETLLRLLEVVVVLEVTVAQ
jgi:hypothetical protein